MKSPSLLSLGVVSTTAPGTGCAHCKGKRPLPIHPILFYRMNLEKICEEAETGLRMFQGTAVLATLLKGDFHPRW
jgi:hypothetical protein